MILERPWVVVDACSGTVLGSHLSDADAQAHAGRLIETRPDSSFVVAELIPRIMFHREVGPPKRTMLPGHYAPDTATEGET